MITFTEKGDFSKIDKYLKRMQEPVRMELLNKYGRKGVEALQSYTPKDSGKTASSWDYKIKNQNGGYSIDFYNSNINEGVSIAIILQYGHATGTGGWVEGRDYINPAIQPVFDELAKEAWKEVSG